MTDSIRNQLNSYLRKASRRRKSSAVTAADGQRFFDRNYPSLSSTERVSYINSIFNHNSEDVVAVGSVPSPRSESKGRMITEWTYIS